MLIGGLIGVNLVLALLAVCAIRLLRSPDPSRNSGWSDCTGAGSGSATDDGALTQLVDRTTTTAQAPPVDAGSLEAMFAFDSRRGAPDRS